MHVYWCAADVAVSSPERGLEHTHRLSVASHLQERLQAQLRNHVGPQDLELVCERLLPRLYELKWLIIYVIFDLSFFIPKTTLISSWPP